MEDAIRVDGWHMYGKSGDQPLACRVYQQEPHGIGRKRGESFISPLPVGEMLEEG